MNDGKGESAKIDAGERMAMVKRDTLNVKTKEPSVKGMKKCYKRRPTTCEVFLLLVVIVLLVVGTVMIYLYVSSTKDKDKSRTESDMNQSELCNTAKCVFTSSGKPF